MRARRPAVDACAVLSCLAGVTLAIVVSAQEARSPALGDIVLDRHSSASGMRPVVFRHWKHRTLYKCYACHPEPFAMEAGANDITLESLRQGAFCARCHDGRAAFPVGFDTCRNCHTGEPP